MASNWPTVAQSRATYHLDAERGRASNTGNRSRKVDRFQLAQRLEPEKHRNASV